MKKPVLISFIAFITVVALYFFIDMKLSQHRTKTLFNEVENHNKLYVYETYFGRLNAVLYVDDIRDTNLLITYYRKLAKADTATAYVNFKIQYMPLTLYKPIYVYRYINKDSKIVELINFDVDCWGYIKGYVYLPTTHLNPPPDTLAKKEERLRASGEYINATPLLRRISPYGWFCNN